MAGTIKADLHMHPHFYNPKDNKRAPDLLQIVNRLFSKNLVITSLSAMHPKPGQIDYRFFDYMTQQFLLERDFETHYDEGKFLYVERKNQKQGQPKSIFILNSQEIRTDYKGMPADINIIGVKKIIESGQDIDETAKIGRQEGGIVTVCHPNDKCGAGIEKALEIYHKGRADAIELDATSPGQYTKDLSRALEKAGLKGLPVSDSHHISEAGTSYALFDSDITNNFSIDDLGGLIRLRDFSQYIGQTRKVSKFVHHTSHILISIPGHLIRNPSYIIKALTKRSS